MRVASLPPGTHAAWSLAAARPDAALVARDDFDAVVAAVQEGEADAAWLPVHNTLAGRVAAGADAVRDWEELDRRRVPIQHHILAAADVGLADVVAVAGHPAALAACRSSLAELGLTGVPVATTAAAAAAAAAAAPGGVAALGGDACASQFDLVVLRRDVQDGPCVTTFVLARPCTAK